MSISTMSLFESINSSVAVIKGPTAINLTIDSSTVIDANYVHIDNTLIPILQLHVECDTLGSQNITTK